MRDVPRRPASRNLGALTRLLGFLRPYGWRATGAALALVVAAGSVLVIGQGLRLVVDQGFMAERPELLDRALAMTLAVIAVMAVASALRFYLVTWIGERVAADLRHAVFRHLLTLEPDFYERNGVGEIQSRVTTDTALLQAVLGSTFSMAIRNVLLLAGTLIMLVITSPRLTALVLVGLPLVLLPMLIFGRRVRRLSRQSQDRIAELGSYAGETLGGIATVQAFGHETEDRRRFDGLVERAFATAGARIRQRAWFNGVALLLAFTAVGAILWQGGHDVLAGRMSAGELSAFVFYAVLAAGSVGVISEVAGEVLRAAGAAERLFELLDARPAIAAPAHPTPLPEPPRGAVSIDGVRFAYPSRPQTPALDDVTLEVRPGERLALVGPSGAGKSTLFALLLRFHDPHAGGIRFDGVDLRDADPAALRARIALVSQEPVLFTGSAAENIRFGRPDADDGAVQAAAAAAHCTAFIEALPKGFDTSLGPGGIQLSGGQRQRIAIARAILRDPALLLLDEATSSLDAESERQVQQALERLMAGRTSIVIAHRLATVTAADRIAVLDQGRLRAVDSHHRLLEQDPLYARLAALQLREPEPAAARPQAGGA